MKTKTKPERRKVLRECQRCMALPCMCGNIAGIKEFLIEGNVAGEKALARKVARSVALDSEVAAWLARQGKRRKCSASGVVNEVLMRLRHEGTVAA